MMTEADLRELADILRRDNHAESAVAPTGGALRRYRVLVLSGDGAEVEVDAENAEAARAIVEASMEADVLFLDDNFVEALTWFEVEEIPPEEQHDGR